MYDFFATLTAVFTFLNSSAGQTLCVDTREAIVGLIKLFNQMVPQHPAVKAQLSLEKHVMLVRSNNVRT